MENEIADMPARHDPGPDPGRDPGQDPDLETEPLALESFLPYRLSLVSNLVSSAIAADYSNRFDLTIAEWRIMAVLGIFAGISATEVGRRTAMDKVQVSRAVARLLSSDRIERLPDHNDRRALRLHLSPAGRHIYDQIVPLARAHEAALVGILNDREREQLDRLMSKLLIRAESYCVRGKPQSPV